MFHYIAYLVHSDCTTVAFNKFYLITISIVHMGLYLNRLMRQIIIPYSEKVHVHNYSAENVHLSVPFPVPYTQYRHFDGIVHSFIC